MEKFEKAQSNIPKIPKLKISLLVPCYNEEASLRASIRSWLGQSRPFDEIVVVDDCSNDATPEILKEFEPFVTAVRTPRNTRNKSSAQEYGLQFLTGDILVATDGDTLLHRHFARRIEKDFLAYPDIAAVSGYVRSLKYNWITTCRALDYVIGQNIDKLAQDYLNFIFVIPGAAGAFRADIFRTLGFEHDTVTEDLDFTYKLHERGYKIMYDRRAICYTQDPATLHSYINQMRRWYGGGWQVFRKHFAFPAKPGMAFELTLIYTEGVVFSVILLALPFLNFFLALTFLGMMCLITFAEAFFGMLSERRRDFFLVIPAYVFLKYVNAWVYLEQFVKEVVLRRKNLVWYKPDRVRIDVT